MRTIKFRGKRLPDKEPETKDNIIMAVAALIAVMIMIVLVLFKIWIDKLYFNWLVN